MPELPEVETTRRGIEPHIQGQTVSGVVVRNPRLRWPVPRDLAKCLTGSTILSVQRRSKYLLLGTPGGTVIIHLGMSGSLRVLMGAKTPKKHDHVDIIFQSGARLRFTDPRRFGAILWTTAPLGQHKLLCNLGPEPLTEDFTAQRLFQLSRHRGQAVKTFIMDAKVVVGVGNIYASEALFKAGIRPSRACGQVSLARYDKLTTAIKETLAQAIEQGGTTLKDFVGSDGRPGYFKQQLAVYGRAGQPCLQCAKPVEEQRLSNRNTFFCKRCQT